jgi:hypothetical protein
MIIEQANTLISFSLLLVSMDDFRNIDQQFSSD